MKDTLRKLKRKRYVTSILIVMLLVFVVGLISLLKPVIKNINIKNVLSKTTSLNASVIDGVSENVSSNNYDEIKYQLKVNKDSDDDEAVITGTLTDKENKYARFKEIKDATVSDNGKKITLTTKRNKVTITVIVSNAPYGTTINPKFKINSEDETKSKIDVDPVTITGKSVEGKIYDENGTYYTGLELSLNNSEGEVKRTYTRDNGEYVFSLGDVDTYEVKLEEEKYQILRYTEETTDENRRVLNIVIREVEPFNLEIKKTISKLDLVINGKKETYNYNDETKVVRSIKNAKTIEGSIYYNIGIKNTGEIKGTLTVLKDKIPEGLSFDESKNPGWTKNGKYIYYTVVEGKEIEPFGKLNATLILDIVKTNEAKTYINTAMASGEDYKYVAYYLNNKLFREEYVISSEKIEDIDPHVENFDGWYTDKEFNNKYNFNNQVLKDIVLFGKISNKKYNVTFMDINPNTNKETILDIKEVEEGTPVSVVDTPSYNGYTFKCFTLNDECYNSEEINEDVTLYTKYTVNQYNITYNLDHGTLDEENPSVYTVKYEITLNNPKKEGYTFIGWTGTGLSELTLNVTIPTGSTGDREYTANYEINKSTLTVDPNGGTYLDNSSSVLYTKDYGTIMQIANSVRRGYKFRKYNKTGGGLFSNGTYTFDNDDATLTAEYGINTYEITYQGLTDEELETLNNPKTFNVETETFTLNEPGTRYDAAGNKLQDFLGWDDGSGNVSINVTIPQGSIDDRTYTAVWKENEDVYTITYYTNGGTTSGQNPTTYTRQSNTFTLYNPSKVGYNFTGWSGTGIDGLSTLVIVEKGSAGDRTYTANYEIIPYTITYENITDDERIALNNPTGYNVETETFTLNEPETRYDAGGNKLQDFLGWDDGNGNVSKNVTITKGSTGNKTYTAVWKENDDSYSITYNLDGGTPTEPNPSTYTRKTETFTLHVPVKDGYIFTGWSGTDLIGDANIIVTIPKGSAGAREYTAHYQAESYTITYNGLTNVEKALLENPTSYTVETETFTLTNPTSRLDNKGYSIEDFVGWDDGNGNVSKNITITKGSSGNRTYTAKWVDNVDEYSITYSLDNGTPSEPNPNTYTRATETFTLHNPSKTGYRFLGWSGTDILGLSTSVTIPKGSAGDRLYYAYYQVIPYTISYNGLTEEEINAINNPSSYDVETNTFTLTNPTRAGYEFDGWTGTGITDKSTSVTIPKGSTGNRVYTAHFKKLEYSLTYTYNGGTPEEENPSKYSIDSDPITLHNPSKAGYTFLGWSGTDLDGNKNTVVTIPTGSTGHRSFLANYNPITYNITYDYNGGELEEGYTNPSTYTIESAPITFATPVKEGYIFTNYTFNGIIMTNIPTGTMGDIDLVANYEIRKYDINYHNENTLYHTEQVNWSTTANKPSTDPTKAHHIFLYWSEDGVNEYDFSTIITTDKDLYAVYEEVIAPEISISPTLDEETNKTWVCGDSSNSDCGVTVTISSEHSDYELYYKVGNGPATLYTEPFKVYENTEVTAWSKKSNINSESVEEDIVNVDTIAPTINEPLSGAMSFNMSVSGTAQDASSGVKKFTLYAKEKSALVFDDNFTYITEDFDGLKDHAENYDHTFYGVQDNTEYIVKIVAEDYVGNISEIEVEVKTKPYVARVVGKNGMLWYTVDPDTKEFIFDREFLMFDSIQSAVNYCANVQCTIQTNPVLPVVNEQVTVAEGQNVTIDLDGRSITSDEEVTFINNGKLQIADRNPRMNGEEHESIGSVTNPTGKAIINNNVLIIGDGSSESSATFIVPELDRPIIDGKVTAIEQNKELHFYDGRIESDTLAITDNGDDVITQYSYNVIVTTDEDTDQNVASMSRVKDPEARIRSTYFAKLNINNAGDAVTSSNKGTVIREQSKLLSKIKQAGDYGFIYDEVNDKIYLGNQSTTNTTSLSYIKLDLTEEETDRFITFDSFIDTVNSNYYGFVSVSETLGETGKQIYKTTGNDVTGSKIYELKKGKVYYIYFGFVKGAGGDLNNINAYDYFEISNFRLLGERQSTNEFVVYSDPTYYPFVKQSDGTYESTNYGINNSISHSYIVYDLRNQTDEITLLINTTIDSHANDFGYIYLSDNPDFQSKDVTAGRYAYTAGHNADVTYNIPLIPGQINYVHFGYQKNDWGHEGADKFVIDSISLSKTKGEELIPSTSKTDDGTYYFESSNNPYLYKWEDSSVNDRDASLSGLPYDSENKGFIFGGRDYGTISNPNFELNNYEETVYVEYSTTNTNSSLIYHGSNKEKLAIGLYNNRVMISTDVSTYLYPKPATYSDGNKHSFMATYNNGEYNLYYDGELLEKITAKDRWSGQTADISIGRRSNGSYPFTGKIYDVRTFDKVITPEEIDNTENLLFHLDGENVNISSDYSSYVSNNSGVPSSTAHSYLTYDLTNVNEDKYLYVNTSISSQASYDFGYVQVTDSTDIPSNLSKSELKVSGIFDNQYAVFKLKKNQVNYVHFVYIKNNSTDTAADKFIINSIKYCNSSEDAYSMNKDNYVTQNNLYFEKPILNTEVDTIELLKGISLDENIVIPQEKEVVLDLNGFTLTSNDPDYIIRNNGKLTIKDSTYEDKVDENVNYKLEQARLFEAAKEQYFADKAEYEKYAGLCEDCEVSEEYKLDHISDYIDEYVITPVVTDFDYANSAQEYTASNAGIYKVEAWGASGSTNEIGGKGAYTSGTIVLDSNDKLYVYTGEQATSVGATFNGGALCSNNCTAGGGATDIRLVSGDWNSSEGLASRIMVAAGGAGYNTWKNGYRGGDGGALTGMTGEGDSPTTGGTQLSGGISYGNVAAKNGTFGKGGNGEGYGGGGSGGYWGGAGGRNSSTGNGGSSGSSYISGYIGSIAIKGSNDLSPRTIEYGNEDKTCTSELASISKECSYHYSGKKFDSAVMKAGNEEMPTYDGTSTMVGNLDNGHAKITYLMSDDEYQSYKNNLEETYNIKEEPKFISYLDGIDFDGTININQLTPESTPTYNDKVVESRDGNITSTIGSVILNEEYATLKLDSGVININANSKNAIENRGYLELKDAVINANNASSIGIFNESNGRIVSTGGTINAVGDSSIGLLNRSNQASMNSVNIVTMKNNAIGLNNNALANVTYTNLDISGAGIGFREFSAGNTYIINSSIKSTNNSSLHNVSQARPSELVINGTTLSGNITAGDTAKRMYINNSNFGNINNLYGYVSISNSNFNYLENRGKATIINSTLTGASTLINNISGENNGTWQSYMNDSKLLLKNSTLNSTATATSVNVIANNDSMTIHDTTINNINGVKSTAINNVSSRFPENSDVYPEGSVAYLNIPDTINIDPSFGTAINNTGIVTLGSTAKNAQTKYEYGYTGHQEEFVAPVTGTYKLETWGAAASNTYDDRRGRGMAIYIGGYGAYASGEIELTEGEKLYVHVGGAGTLGQRDDGMTSYFGSYNGGGAPTSYTSWGQLYGYGAGGGATDISRSDEDDQMYFDNGYVTYRRSAASYAQRILVAGGGSGCTYTVNCYGGYEIDPSTSQLGYSTSNGGGGYYGGKYQYGGSSYASDSLTNVDMRNGRQEMPDYNTPSSLMKGNNTSGYARITLLDTATDDSVTESPVISATNYGITGAGRVRFLDGTINANVALNTDVELVPDNYDIYTSKDANNKEKIILVNNDNSRPVPTGEEEFVAKIGNAKYTTIQKALDASNNGDTIELLANIEQQNKLVIPSNMIITIDYKGHTVKSYNPDCLFENHGNLTITDSVNNKGKNTFNGDKYIYNDGTLNLSKVYIGNHSYTVNLIENDGTITMNDVKLEFGNPSIEGFKAISNSQNATITVNNSVFNLRYKNTLFDNNGSLTISNSTFNNELYSEFAVYNHETGTVILDGNTLVVTGHDQYGRYLLNNEGTATVKNMTSYIEDILNAGSLTLEDNNIPSGTLTNTGVLIINSGTYKNVFNINSPGKSIDNTDKLYSLIMRDGTINTTLNINSTGISSIEGGTISVASGYAINNTGTGIISLGINDGIVLPKGGTTPVITGKTYGIYTSNPALIVDFYDGIVSGTKSYNVTVRKIETGYSIRRDYDSTNDIESKYLTDEPMFENVTHAEEYATVDELNTALSNGSIVNDDVIKVYRDITISNNDNSITIPQGLNITFDINGKVVDKNNTTMFINNGELLITDSVNNSTGKIDSTIGNVIENNGTINISSGSLISEKGSVETEVIKNNAGATLNISGGTFTKYYDWLGQVVDPKGSIINNIGTTTVTGGKFYTNASYGEHPDFVYSSVTFINRENGTLIVTGGEYDGITGYTVSYDGALSTSYSTHRGVQSTTKGILLYNYGIASIENIESNQSNIGYNSGTITIDNLTMTKLLQMVDGRWNSYHGGYLNFNNTGNVTITDSYFEIGHSFLNNNGGNVTISNTTIDRLIDGYNINNSDVVNRTLQLINNFTSTGEINIIDSNLYHRGTGEILYNKGLANIVDSNLETNTNNAIVSIGGTLNVKGDSSVVSNTGNYSGVSLSGGSVFTLGEPIEVDGEVSQTKPLIKGTTYGVNNSGSTFNFYDGLIEGKTLAINGVTSSIEFGYTPAFDTDGDYKTNYLARIPIVQNITQATASDEKKYYDLKTAFEEASSGDTLQMLANYSNLITEETAVNDTSVTFDLNGKTIRQSNDLLIQNNGTLNIVDNSQNIDGNIQMLSGTNILSNNGTVNFIGGKLSTNASSITLIKNNAGGTLTIKDNAIMESTNTSTLIDSSGTTNIYNGAYFRDTRVNAVVNRGILNVIDLNNDDDENTSSNLRAPQFYTENTYNSYQAVNPATIHNTAGANVTLYGGIYNNGDTVSPNRSIIIYNSGTATIKNLHSYTYHLGFSGGTLNIENSHLYHSTAGTFISYGGSTANFKNVVIEVSEVTGEYRMQLDGTTTMDNVSIISKNENTNYNGSLAFVRGPLTITNSSFSANVSQTFRNDSNLIIENSVITNSGISSSGTIDIDHTTINANGTALNTSGTANIKNNSTLTSNTGDAVINTGTLNVLDTTRIISNSANGITLNGNGKLTIGEMGGTPDVDNPYIEGLTYGVNRTTQTSTFNFYDGRIVGGSGPNAIAGGVTNVESEYELEDVIVQETNKHHEYLVHSASYVAVAKVANYTFTSAGTISPSKALQNAINFAIGDGTNVNDVDLLTSVDLVNDGEIITASMPVTINLYGNTINQSPDYYLDSKITLNNGNSLGANLSKLLGDVFDISDNPKNIIVYELSDGSRLDTTKTYKLYKDGELISLEKEELGKYRYKGDNEELTPIRGRLYLDNLYKGDYKLKSSDNKSIEFSIDSEGNITGNVTENTNQSSSTGAFADTEAELILQIQTGKNKHYYFLLIIPIILILGLLIIINKNKKREA